MTLRDVARVAGVSPSMVSRVLRGAGRTSAATRKVILETADRLGYRPDILAQSLASGRSLTVGVLCVPNLHGFVVPILVGAQQALMSQGLASFLYCADPSTDRGSWQEGLNRFKARRVDAVVVIGDKPDRVVPSVADTLPVPAVYAFVRSTNLADDVLTPDGLMAGRLAGQHFIESGRTRIAHITGNRALPAVQDRVRGLREALSEAGLGLALDGPLYGESWSRSWGETAARTIIERRSELDAVFCGNDRIATALHTVLTNSAVAVPDDVAIVGYDNVSRLENEPDDFLTTIDPNLPELGETAIEHLAAAMTGEAPSGLHLTPCTLVTRRSSGSRTT